jgi:hypothetical protein
MSGSIGKVLGQYCSYKLFNEQWLFCNYPSVKLAKVKTVLKPQRNQRALSPQENKKFLRLGIYLALMADTIVMLSNTEDNEII